MALTPGTKLGPYEIQSPLGAGGMGEVYRARDTRLGRDVALKILPESFIGDEDRLHRFEQETRAVAALNHPNILAIHDVGRHNGSPFLVCELLEGETLRAVLERGALPQRKAVEYGVQIAEGLAAHEKGIVHRDLKPENLFLTKDGRVKILDFGLAKLAPKPGGPADGPTLTGSQTAVGTVIGTASYMAPEQVRGETIDPRTDIFAFGALLFEMLSGQRVFSRDTTAETMTAVLKADPPELIGAAPALDRIVRRCLEKSPEQRFQSAKDLSFALAALSGSDTSAAARAALKRRKLPPLLWVAMPLALALVALAIWLGASRRLERKPAPVLHQLTFRRGTVWNARFAPDGNSVIYGAAWEGKPVEIFESRVDLAEARALGISGADVLAISDKGEMAVALQRKHGPSGFGFNGTLARLSLTGGVPREVMERVESADWAPDGSLAISYHAQGKARLEFPIGTLRYESATWISHVRVSPKGGMVAFIDHDDPVGDAGVVRVVGPNLNLQLTRDYGSAQGLAWSPTGAEIWYTADEGGGSTRSLHAVDLQGHERILYRVPGTLKIQDIAKDGRVLLVHELIWAGILAHVPGESGERELGWLDWSIGRKLSNDGKWLLFDESGAAPGNQTWIYLRRTDGAPPVKLGEGAYCDLSADGKWVAAAPGRLLRPDQFAAHQRR